MRHAEHDLFDAEIAATLDDLLKRRNQRLTEFKSFEGLGGSHDGARPQQVAPQFGCLETNGLNVLEVPSSLQVASIGVLVIVALVIDSMLQVVTRRRHGSVGSA